MTSQDDRDILYVQPQLQQEQEQGGGSICTWVDLNDPPVDRMVSACVVIADEIRVHVVWEKGFLAPGSR